MDQHSKITEADSNVNKIVTSQWCNLSNHLLSQIFTARLGLKELLKIRGVCKHWKSASSEALAQIESSQFEPWFLMYGEGSKCSLLSNEDYLYTLHIPELDMEQLALHPMGDGCFYSAMAPCSSFALFQEQRLIFQSVPYQNYPILLTIFLQHFHQVLLVKIAWLL